MKSIQNFLGNVLAHHSTKEAIEWLTSQLNKYQASLSDTSFYMTYGRAPRMFGHDRVNLTNEEKSTANKLRKGFQLDHWEIGHVARAFLTLHLPTEPSSIFQEKIEKLFTTADMGEQVALFNSFAILPHPKLFINRAREGFRTNITDVFDALALNNPYPADFLPEDAWNQMVLKAAFMDRPLYKIIGIERRANPILAKIVSDYAHERWSAGRTVSPELWRLVGSQLLPEMLPDIERLLQSKHPLERQAAILVCLSSPLASAKQLINHTSIEHEGVPNWESIALEWWRIKDQ